MSDYDNPTAGPKAMDNVVAMPAASEDLSILTARAPIGRLSDTEAETVAGSDRACWALRVAWEDDPPETRVLADVVVHDRVAMRRLIEKVHLDTQTDNAKQTAQRLREIEALSMVEPRLLNVLADTLDSDVTSFDPDGIRILSQFDVPGGSWSQFTASPRATARALDKDGLVVLEVTLRDDVHDAVWLAAVYQTPPQPDQSADVEPQLVSVSPVVEHHRSRSGPTIELPVLELETSDVGMVRLFIAPAPVRRPRTRPALPGPGSRSTRPSRTPSPLRPLRTRST